MFMSILFKLPGLLVTLALVAAIAIIYFRSKNVNRSEFTQIFKTANYINLWVVVACICVIGLYAAFNHIQLRKSVHSIISLNYSEASAAQNSNGTRYNMAEIISDEVVERAIKKGALEDVTTKQLKDCLVVYPCVQGSVDDESNYHISTEFAVEYHASEHTSHLDTENVIHLITAAYKEYYIEKYTDNFKLDSEKPDFENMEYMDTVSYFNKETNKILDYLYGMSQKNSSFVTENGSTFNSIAGKVYQFRETQINENLKALVLQDGLSKDKDIYLERLEYKNKDLDFDRQKSAASFDVCNKAISLYSEEMISIVLVPTWDKEGKYYMGRTKVGVDELSVKASEFSNDVVSSEKQIMDNNLIIEKMKNGTSSEESYKAADELVNTVYSDLKAFEKEAVNAGREYYNHRMNQCISVTVYGVSLMDELKSIVMFAAFAYVSLMLFVIARKFPKKA